MGTVLISQQLTKKHLQAFSRKHKNNKFLFDEEFDRANDLRVLRNGIVHKQSRISNIDKVMLEHIYCV